MNTPKKVLVLDTSPDLLELTRILLSAEGYDVVTSNYEGADLALVKSHAPDMILFDLVKDRAEPWVLLEQLGDDPETRSIGVMVTSATPALLEKALGDPRLPVSTGLLMPFDIDDLYARLDEAISHTPAEVSPGGPAVIRSPALQAAAQALGDQRRNILFRWVQRVSTLEIYRQRPDLALDEVLGEMGALLDVLVSRLLDSEDTMPVEALGEIVERHIALRRRLGLTPAEIVHEFSTLRSEVNRTLRGALQLWRLSLTDVMLAQEHADEGIDALIGLSVETCWRHGSSPAPSSAL